MTAVQLWIYVHTYHLVTYSTGSEPLPTTGRLPVPVLFISFRRFPAGRRLLHRRFYSFGREPSTCYHITSPVVEYMLRRLSSYSARAF